MKQLNKYILEYCRHLEKNGVPVRPLPNLKYNTLPQEGSMEDQKTDYYDPSAKTVVLYTHARNDKDILRSFAHELVHHQQNLKGTLKPEIQTTDTNDSEELNKLEKEAYLQGNILLRNFLDELKED